MKGRFTAFVPLILLVALGVAAAFVLLRGGARHDMAEVGLVGRPVPGYAMPLLSGKGTLTSERFAGQPYLINFFASWCVPCRLEHPELVRLAQTGIPIVGVAYKDDAADAQRFLDELGDPFAAVGLDQEGRYALEIGLAGVPETFLIGSDGAILAIHRGELDRAAADRLLAKAR